MLGEEALMMKAQLSPLRQIPGQQKDMWWPLQERVGLVLLGSRFSSSWKGLAVPIVALSWWGSDDNTQWIHEIASASRDCSVGDVYNYGSWVTLGRGYEPRFVCFICSWFLIDLVLAAAVHSLWVCKEHTILEVAKEPRDFDLFEPY